MFQATRRNIVIVMLMCATVFLGIAIPTIVQLAIAQEFRQNNDMRELLETLNARIEEEAPFQVMFRFGHPLMDNEELFWEIPYTSPDREISRWIGEIGDDFVCFNEQAGSSGVARCTPFSNIVSVSYLGNP